MKVAFPQRRIWILFLTAILALGMIAFLPILAKDTAKKPTTKERIADIKSRIDEQRRLQKEAKAQELDILSKLDKIDNRLVEIEKNLMEIKVERDELLPQVKEATEKLELIQKDLEYRQQMLARRIRETYKRGRYQQVSVLVSSRDIDDLTRRVRFLLAMAGEDRRQARAVANRRNEAAQAKAELDAQKADLDELLAMAEDERGELIGTKSSRNAALTKVRAQKESYSKLIAKLEADKGELERILEGSASRTPTGTIKKHTGKAPPPASVRSPTKGDVVRRFGLIEGMYGTVTRNEGIDIAAPYGSEIKSVLAGRVLLADWFHSYGKVVIIDHGRGFVTIYAHCSDLLVHKDSVVSEGQIIALVGDTGTLGETMLHFETRMDGKAIDPLAWLRGK